MHLTPQVRLSPWPHRLAVVLALVTFPLIWVGGLVTTYDAGMAVPDWPGTYGYNLFLYPWQTWLSAPWNLFIEHGHRLLGASAGLIAIALVAVVLLTDRRRWLVAAALGALALVIFQGILGGARVVFDARLVALIHGCVGPLFFAYLAALIALTTSHWQFATPGDLRPNASLWRAGCVAVGLTYLQLVLGALLRHIPLSASVQLFRAALLLHLVVAAVLTVHILVTAWQARRLTPVRFPAIVLVSLIFLQLVLGASTYIAKYSWPAWLADYPFAAAYVVQEKGLTQSLITTAHVATGSLILFVTVTLAIRAMRLGGSLRNSEFRIQNSEGPLFANSALRTPRSALRA
jgi:cytochrome c oxidase assembly protein subunit 15